MEQVKILDSTLYGGGQSPGACLNLEEKLEIARLLQKMQVDIIQVGFPISSPNQFTTAHTLAVEIKDAAVCALARAREEDIDVAAAALKGAAHPLLQVGLGVSDSYIVGKLKTSREAALDLAVEAVRYARRYVDQVQYYAADACRADLEFLYCTLTAVIDAGATTIAVADSIGFGLPSEWGALIRGIQENVPNIDRAVICVHCHNDLGLATANSLEAVVNGARQVECAVNGIGERTGNACLEEVAMALRARRDALNLDTNLDTRLIYPASQLVSHLTGLSLQPNKAIVGDRAFAYTSGMYQDGVLHGRTQGEILDPSDIGILESRTLVPLLTGREGLRRFIRELGFTLEDDEFERVYSRFRAVARKKPDLDLRDLEGIVSGETSVFMKETYELEEVQVMCGTNVLATATVRLQGPAGEAVSASRSGNGPIDAAFKAIDSVIQLPNELLEFSVQALTEGVDALAKVAVRIRGEVPLGDTGRVEARVFLGRGADTDTIVAGAKAYVFALNRLLAARQASRRRKAITEEVKQVLEEMQAQYGTAHVGDYWGVRAMRDEDLI